MACAVHAEGTGWAQVRVKKQDSFLRAYSMHVITQWHTSPQELQRVPCAAPIGVDMVNASWQHSRKQVTQGKRGHTSGRPLLPSSLLLTMSSASFPASSSAEAEAPGDMASDRLRESDVGCASVAEVAPEWDMAPDGSLSASDVAPSCGELALASSSPSSSMSISTSCRL